MVEPFALPDLDENIVHANALISTDFPPEAAEDEDVPVFEWWRGTSKIARIMGAGGFDLIAGNPPYISPRDANRYFPRQYRYLREHYASMGEGQPGVAYAFIERGLGLRRIIAQGRHLEELIDLGAVDVFEDVITYPAILILSPHAQDHFLYARLSTDEKTALPPQGA